MVIAGVMSGSSLDGLDIAIVEFGSHDEWKILWSHDMPYSEEWVNRLKNYHKLSAAEYITLVFDYSNHIGQTLKEVFVQYPGEINYLSFHGHTLMHLPEKGITEQIGNGGVIAALANIPTITDFRVQDVTKGGVGTPLAPLVELNLFNGHDYYLNLGGIANITKVENKDGIIAYDVCPCNQVLNYYSNLAGKDYDKDGNMARAGSKLVDLESYLDAIPFFSLEPPKSLDNNWIMNEVIPNFPEGKIEDVLHTYTHWMARCIANEVEVQSDTTSLMVTGGGTHNIYFMECLKNVLTSRNCELHIPTKEIIDFKEAILMSLMAYKYINGSPIVMSAVTGASSDSIGGALYKVGYERLIQTNTSQQ